MGENCTDEVLIETSFPEITGSKLAMFFRMLLIVEVVEQADHAPILCIFSVEFSKVAHSGLHRNGVMDQGLGMGVGLEKFQRCSAVHGKCHCDQSSDFLKNLLFRTGSGFYCKCITGSGEMQAQGRRFASLMAPLR